MDDDERDEDLSFPCLQMFMGNECWGDSGHPEPHHTGFYTNTGRFCYITWHIGEPPEYEIDEDDLE